MTHECRGPSLEEFKAYVAQRDLRKPEQHVLDDIEALVNEELTHVPDDYTRNTERYVKCELCHGNWHGLPYSDGCPGAYASQERIKEWLESPRANSRYVGYVTTEHQGVLVNVHFYLDGHNGFVGLMMPLATDDVDRPGLSCDLYTFDEAHVLEFRMESDVPHHDYVYIPIDDMP